MASGPNRLCYLLEPLPSFALSKMRLCGVKVWESISGAPVCGRPNLTQGENRRPWSPNVARKEEPRNGHLDDPQRRETLRTAAELLQPRRNTQ